MQLQSFGKIRHLGPGGSKGFERLAVATLIQIELAQSANGLKLRGVAAPTVSQTVVDQGGLRRRNGAGLEPDLGSAQQRL